MEHEHSVDGYEYYDLELGTVLSCQISECNRKV